MQVSLSFGHRLQLFRRRGTRRESAVAFRNIFRCLRYDDGIGWELEGDPRAYAWGLKRIGWGLEVNRSGGEVESGVKGGMRGQQGACGEWERDALRTCRQITGDDD